MGYNNYLSDLSLADIIRDEFKKLHLRIDSMERRQDALDNKVDILLAHMQDGGGLGKSVPRVSDSSILPTLPLSTLAELRAFEDDLKNSEDVRKQLVSFNFYLGTYA